MLFQFYAIPFAASEFFFVGGGGACGETLVILALRTHKAKETLEGGGDVQKPPLFSFVKR